MTVVNLTVVPLMCTRVAPVARELDGGTSLPGWSTANAVHLVEVCAPAGAAANRATATARAKTASILRTPITASLLESG
jgi:hypothetical protein